MFSILAPIYNSLIISHLIADTFKIYNYDYLNYVALKSIFYDCNGVVLNIYLDHKFQ